MLSNYFVFFRGYIPAKTDIIAPLVLKIKKGMGVERDY